MSRSSFPLQGKIDLETSCKSCRYASKNRWSSWAPKTFATGACVHFLAPMPSVTSKKVDLLLVGGLSPINVVHSLCSLFGKKLAPIQNSKTAPQAKQGKAENAENPPVGLFLIYICPILKVAAFSYPVGGQLFPNSLLLLTRFWVQWPSCQTPSGPMYRTSLSSYSPMYHCELVGQLWTSRKAATSFKHISNR